jgi:cytochrome c-type biogenesis protein CcmH
MLLFLILAGLISGGAALLILLRAARAGVGAVADPRLEVYRRQLTEIDEMAERGLLGEEERKAAHAEAGRRLLGEAERPPERSETLSPKATRLAVLSAAVAAPLLALLAYLLTGAPGLPDMPYKTRLAGWQRTDPAHLPLPEMAAVLSDDVKKKPNDPQGYYYLGLVERAEGDLPSAIEHLERAADLNPSDAKTWATLGTALVERDQDQVGAAAQDAFRRALALDPSAVQPRYFLGRAEIASGHVEAGLADWRALLAALPAQDPRRGVLEGEILQVTRTGQLDQAPAQADQGQGAASDQTSAFIQSMVARQEADLKAHPDDPAGWARLIRAYGVLRRPDRQKAAVAEVRRLFKDRPTDLKTALEGQNAPAPAPIPPG